jgi:NADH-quinone oxidoreductase subunit J
MRHMPAPSVVAVVGAGAGLLAFAVARVVTHTAAGAMPAVADGYGSPAHIARRLFTDFLVPFEITSVLLLVAIVGAVVLGKRRI